MIRTYSLRSVLNITTGVLTSDIQDIYSILNFMTGDNLYTHQFGRASKFCKPYLLTQFPQLANVNFDGCKKSDTGYDFADLKDHIARYENDFGTLFHISNDESLAAYKAKDLFAEMHEMRNSRNR